MLIFLFMLGQVETNGSSVTSKILVGSAGDLCLAQELVIQAPLDRVWEAYTSEKGWKAWVAPIVEIDFKVGGTIKTHYDPASSIGDPGTNQITIVNYVPETLLTLQADLTDNWPHFMKEDQARLYNVIFFEALDRNRTRVMSYGSGYRNNEDYRNLMDFFIQANTTTMEKLKKYLETN